MTKQQQFNEYQNNGGTMPQEEWENDPGVRYNPYEEPSYTNMDMLLMLHINCVNALRKAKESKDSDVDRAERHPIIEACAEAEAALLKFYDETESFKVKIHPWH